MQNWVNKVFQTPKASIKKLISFPLLPITNPTNDYHATHKKYVDATANSLALMGSDIASGTTVAVSASAHYFNVTGTTTITAISQASGLFIGREVEFVFVSSLQLTHGANFILPGAINTQVYAGDVVTFVCENSSTPVWRCTKISRNINNSFCEVISDQTVSNVASVVFTGLDSAKYSKFELEISNAIPATDGANVLIRMSTDGGSSYDSGATQYEYAGYETPTSAATDYITSSGDSAIKIGTAIGNQATEGYSGSVKLKDLGSTTNYKNCSIHGTKINGSTVMYNVIESGRYKSTSAVNALQFLFSTGNVGSGRFVLRGYK